LSNSANSSFLYLCCHTIDLWSIVIPRSKELGQFLFYDTDYIVPQLFPQQHFYPVSHPPRTNLAPKSPDKNAIPSPHKVKVGRGVVLHSTT